MYGLTDDQIEAAKKKVTRNRNYMMAHGIEVSGRFVPYADFIFNSYMNPHRYIAELNNRVYSLYEYAQRRGLANVFFTLTLPSVWHATKLTRSGKRVPNPSYGGRKYLCRLSHPLTGHKIKIINPESNRLKYIPRNASKQLTKMLKRLFDDRFFKSIPKSHRVYFRVTEPHKSGTPHIHVSFFVPVVHKDRFVDLLRRLYPAPAGKVEADISNPVAYLMKYILKTLDDLRSSDDLTALSLWYVYHGISRIYTSRTLIDLSTYRACKGRYSMLELTNMYNDGLLTVLLDESNKINQIFDEYGPVYTRSYVQPAASKRYDPVPSSWVSPPKPVYIPVEIDGDDRFYYSDGRLYQDRVTPPDMSDIELFDYYHSLDIDSVNMHHFGYTKNEMISRGLLDGEILPLDEYYNVSRI